jgi:uncharacterized membrane protein YbhN (UPF0104 family)
MNDTQPTAEQAKQKLIADTKVSIRGHASSLSFMVATCVFIAGILLILALRILSHPTMFEQLVPGLIVLIVLLAGLAGLTARSYLAYNERLDDLYDLQESK